MRKKTGCERLLEVLSDGNPHSHHELYGLRLIVHSRIAELRKRGHTIHCWKAKLGRDFKGRDVWTYYYRLDTSLKAAGSAPTQRESVTPLPISASLAGSAALSEAVDQDVVSGAGRPRSSEPERASLDSQPALFDLQETPPWA